MEENKLNVVALAAFLDYCEKNNLKPGSGSVLRNYANRRASDVGYKLDINKLKGSMAENNITQKDIANYVSMSEMQISRKFSGKTDFTVKQLLKISELLKEHPSVFFTVDVDNISTKYSEN